MALRGRETEMRVIATLLEGIGNRGGALVVSGEPGIGKSALLTVARDLASERGMSTLIAAGVQSESHLPFAGLHQLLRPALHRLDAMPTRQRDAVLAAFGLTDAAAPEPFLIALAVLDLLAEEASDDALLIVADDAQWLDRPTCDVLTFVARRLESDPVAVLIGVRDGVSSPFDSVDVPRLSLGGLDEAAARAVLDDHSPGLAPETRDRLVAEAAGNPLALVELPSALSPEHLGGEASLPAWLPLTARLERAFALRVADLPPSTRMLLLVAALDDGGVLSEVIEAASAVGGGDLSPAVTAGLVDLDGDRLRFRHPLMRSAIHQSASAAERYAAHAALADVLATQPDRSVWHRAAARLGPEEEVASALEEAAKRAQRRGAVPVAVAALERAAQLSPEPDRRVERLLRAAELAFEVGSRDVVARLLRAAEPLDLQSRERTRMAWIRESFDDGIPGAAVGVRALALADVAEESLADGDTHLALNLLQGAALRCWWVDPGAAVRDRVAAIAERADAAWDDPRLLAISAWTAPVDRGAIVMERLARVASSGDADGNAGRLFGMAATAVGDHELASAFLAASVEGLRSEGRLGLLAQSLVMRAWAAVHLGVFSSAMADADEGARLARETSQPYWAARATACKAIISGLRGDEDSADALAADAERVSLPSGAAAVLADVQFARGLTALGHGRFGDAYQNLRRLFDPSDPSHHHMKRVWAIGDLAEAAIHCGQGATARALVDELEAVADRTPSPCVHGAMRYARALLADADRAEPAFMTALSADSTQRPFPRARLLLAHGTWLRRQSRVVESREPLRSARDSFDALGALPWADRAGGELRAAGERSRRAEPNVWSQLTPQEFQIAQMAAEGLSNREIGQRLFLSHRTISSHLYRIFPKVGITSRNQLGVAFEGATTGAHS